MKKIIIVDDDSTNNHICETMIHKLLKDVEVISFVNPVKAFEYLKSNNPGPDGLVIIDVNMPEMSGWQLINLMNESNVVVPIIMLTSSISHQDKETASEIKMVREFFVKPINPGMITGLNVYMN